MAANIASLLLVTPIVMSRGSIEVLYGSGEHCDAKSPPVVDSSQP
jgi:hypothetical protein